MIAGKKRSRRQPKGESDDLGHIGWRVDAEIARHEHREQDRHAREQQLFPVADLGHVAALEQVVGDRRGNHQQQPRRGRQCRRQPARGHERHHPVGQSGDFRVRQHHDVAVDVKLVGFHIAGVLDATVAIAVVEADQAGGFPLAEPFGHRAVFDIVHGVDQVGAGEGGDGRRGGVENRDEDQRVAGGFARLAHPRHGEEADDDVGQAGGADHQRRGDEKHVLHAALAFGVGGKAELFAEPVEAVEQIAAAEGIGQLRAEAKLGNRVARHQDGDEDRRHHEGENQHAILGDLGVGDALHAAEHGVEEDDGHADHHAIG